MNVINLLRCNTRRFLFSNSFLKIPKSTVFRTNSNNNSNLYKKFQLQNFKIFQRSVKNESSGINKLATSVRKNDKVVGYWLLSCSGMVFVAVVLGGVTRLTESGLSMVHWKFLGEKFPKNEQDWIQEFQKYQLYPEFQIKNHDMNLSEFKRIYIMEYLHRMWGRAIGICFLVPAMFFWSRGWLQPKMKPRIVAYGGLIIFQGLLGWYMVRSGLDHSRFKEVNSSEPRVSQYRLAAHLSTAFILYMGLLYSALRQLMPLTSIDQQQRQQLIANIRGLKQFKIFAHSCKAMIFLTAFSGAFVAGLDAGLVYNSFPKFGDRWLPSDLLVLQPKISNITENPTTVQFQHRVLATVTCVLIAALWLRSLRFQKMLPKRARLAIHSLAALVVLQVSLGIATLLHYVPVSLAASHQSGSLALLSNAVWLTHELKKMPKI